ncbi:toprim domain-containing protein [Mucilaginibacter boryungensis]|uniref:Toprim domain-containing protein n=1 Tax=Mucilaginibacter boryungensis TaxID=768480 RepID=A0ABR9XMD0_9SPHI|nr:toprim domain-containing protein [Mucilaginibacter boryungensis]MBE9668098.1 toprim domain-containing protein [Mucilaginibacter boryungensis]
MDKKLNSVSCNTANQIDLVTYLADCGFEPVKVRGENYWYLSPLRSENTASFKINRRLNRWYDHGIGKGGKLVDLGISLFDCSVSEFLKKLTGSVSSHKPSLLPFATLENVPIITVEEVKPIQSPALLKYLCSRKIAIELALKYCCQVHYSIGPKTFYALGFANGAGGYELRSKYFKGSSSPKGLTLIKNGFDQLCIFEGFFDFLSYLTIYQNRLSGTDYLILNSLSFFEKAILLSAGYNLKRLYLDRDKAGQNCSRQAIAMKQHYFDESGLYYGYKDLNDYLVYKPTNGQQ